jgi:S1-C subfamily serine protease
LPHQHGLFITDDGYLVSNYHVVKDATKVRLLTGLRRDEVATATQAGAGLIDAKVVRVDAANDLALLKADGRFAPLPIAASRTVALWAARWRRWVFPTSVCRGSRPKFLCRERTQRTQRFNFFAVYVFYRG